MYNEIPMDISQIDKHQIFKRNLKFYIADSLVQLIIIF